MDGRELRLEYDGDIAAIVIDRPDRRNALTQAMWQRLIDISAQIDADRRARLVLLRSSTPGIFSAGADVTEYREHATDLDWSEESQRVVGRALGAVAGISVPTLAVVDGPCFGGGCGLVVAADWCIATQASTFAITPAKLGMVYPFPATVDLVDRVGASAAKWLLFTGAAADAQRAQRIGLVDDLAADAAGLADLQAHYVGMMQQTSAHSVRIMKQAIARVRRGEREPDATTAGWVRLALESADYREGVSSFMERRSPQFGGG
jgi:enoyl-CoA hydratase/carnithine racemase